MLVLPSYPMAVTVTGTSIELDQGFSTWSVDGLLPALSGRCGLNGGQLAAAPHLGSWFGGFPNDRSLQEE